MADAPTARGTGVAAFFDLDKTTIDNAALFAFSSTLKDCGLLL